MATKPKTDKKKAKRLPQATPAEPNLGESTLAAFIEDSGLGMFEAAPASPEPAPAQESVAVAVEDMAPPTPSPSDIFDIPDEAWDGVDTAERCAEHTTSIPRHTWWDRLAALWRKKPGLATESALVFEKRRYGVESIPTEVMPDPASLWLYEGNWVYLLERRDGALQAVTLEMVLEAASKKENIPPDKLYRALNWKEAEILFKIPDTLLEKINLALTVVLVGILVFFCFLIYATITEGPAA